MYLARRLFVPVSAPDHHPTTIAPHIETTTQTQTQSHGGGRRRLRWRGGARGLELCCGAITHTGTPSPPCQRPSVWPLRPRIGPPLSCAGAVVGRACLALGRATDLIFIFSSVMDDAIP